MNRTQKILFIAASLLIVTSSCARREDGPDAEKIDIYGFEDTDVPFSGTQELAFTVNANRDWRISRGESNWIDVIPNQGKAGRPAEVRIVVEPNRSEARKGAVTFTAGSFKKTVSINQEASPVIARIDISGIKDNRIEFASTATDPVRFSVESTVNWTAATSALEWAEVGPLSGNAGQTVEISVTPSENQGPERKGSITFSAEGLDDIIITVVQSKLVFTDPVWTWSLDEESIRRHIGIAQEDPELNTYTATDDHYRGILQFIHTHDVGEYVTSLTPAADVGERPSYIEIRPASAKNAMGYGYLGGLVGDYWEFVCPVDSPLPSGTVIHVRFLVFGSNQSAAFWNGSYIIDDGEEVMLHLAEQTYAGGGKATKPTWEIKRMSSYVFGWDAPGSNYIIPHLVEENITLDRPVNSTFRFRLTVADNTFSKAITAWDDATGRTFPSSSLAIVPSATYYEGTEDKAIIEALP